MAATPGRQVRRRLRRDEPGSEVERVAEDTRRDQACCQQGRRGGEAQPGIRLGLSITVEGGDGD